MCVCVCLCRSLYTVAALDGQTAHHLQDCLLEVVDDARHQCVLLVGHNKVRVRSQGTQPDTCCTHLHVGCVRQGDARMQS